MDDNPIVASFPPIPESTGVAPVSTSVPSVPSVPSDPSQMPTILPVASSVIPPPAVEQSLPVVTQETSFVPNNEQTEPPLPPKPKVPLKPLILGLIFVFVFTSSALGIYFMQTGKFTFFQKAQTEGKLICTPINGAGNPTNDTCNNKKMRVTNNTSNPVDIIWQYNFCPLNGVGACPISPPICSDRLSLVNAPATIEAGETRDFSVDIACGKYGQLDMYQDMENFPGQPQCTKADGSNWTAARPNGPAIAFTYGKGETTCPVSTPTPTGGQTAVCLSLTAFKLETNPPSLENLQPGDTVRFSITPEGNIAGVQAAMIRLLKNGVKIGDFATSLYQGKWINNYMIPPLGAGSYEVMGFIKVNGVWK